LGKRRAEKGECEIYLSDLIDWSEGLILGVMPGERLDAPLSETLVRLAEEHPGPVRLMAAMTYGPGDRRRLARLRTLASKHRTPLCATNDVHFHHPDRRELQNVLTAIREHVTIAEAGRLLAANAERHLKSTEEMVWLFRDHCDAIAESIRIFEELKFSLDELQYQYPDEPTGVGPTPQAALVKLTEEGAKRRWPNGIPAKVQGHIDHELQLIEQLEYAPYFLTVYDIVRFAREKGILCQGRGSAANSAVCFCLGITEVDPERIDLLFERFISPERNEPPDIDVDFEHERREEVIQYIYEKYGRDRAGLAATVISYRSRSAIREVGKVFGLSDDTIGALSGSIWGWSIEAIDPKEARRIGLDPEARNVQQALAVAKEITGFPRHLSQHVGGFVITRDRLDEVTPVANAAMEDRTTVEWDKDDLDALGMLKIDVLALGMLSCIRKAFAFLDRDYGRSLTLATIPAEEPDVYRMVQRADTIGVFQIESRAQMTMLPRLKPASYYDLVIEVAIVRPGPIQGDMVHPYLRRRQGLEEVHFPSPSPEHGPPDELERVLGKTLGVPLFQEQAMKIAIVAAGFEPGEADRLRRAMATFRRVGTIGTFRTKMIEGMTSRGYEEDFAERCFKQIEGFGDYGFPESHAASFALLVYASAWIKCHYPDVFCAALLNAQPMGFYAPAQIVRDAREHGVEVREIDVNLSFWDSELEAEEPSIVSGQNDEPELTAGARVHRNHASMREDIHTTHAVRLGFRQIKGFAERDANLIESLRGDGFDSVRDLWLRTGLVRGAIERLSDADAFRSLGLDRRDALWAARSLDAGSARERMPLFDRPELTGAREYEPDFGLPPMPLGEHVVNDYRFLSLSLKAHPVDFLRKKIATLGVIRNEQLAETVSGRRVKVSGLVLVRQRPGTASGVIFATLEDETRVANIVVWPKTFEKYRPVVLGGRFIIVTGKVQNESGVIHVIADHLEDRTAMLATLTEEGADLEALAHADEVRKPGRDLRGSKLGPRGAAFRHPRNEPISADMATLIEETRSVLPKGRNFH
ncbi:MAG: error-prone DNA polymerase, partial [Alphaproteobacteria bacterium]